jgi:hypothetical protein
MKRNDLNLYGWVFTYNPYEGIWYATDRNDYFLLFSDRASKKVLKSTKIDVLVDLVRKTNGEESEIKKLIK